jgi:hypothetical protein
MPPLLVFIIVGLLLLYIGYLRLQLHIQESVQHKIEQLAVVIPTHVEAEGKPNYGLGLALLLMAVVGLGMLIR